MTSTAPRRGRSYVTPDAPRPDLDEAERWFPYWETVGCPSVDPDAAEEREAARTLHAEYDRRGAALADAQAEVARLRAAVDEQADEVVRQTHVVVSKGQREALEGIARDLRALAAAPAPAGDSECPPICGELGSLHGPGHPCVLPPGHELHRDGVGGEWTHPPAHWGPAPAPAREQADPANEEGDRG